MKHHLGKFALALALSLSLLLPQQGALHAVPAASIISGGYGADSCAAPSTSQMQAFYTGTRFTWWGIYIGGVNRSCSQPNLTPGWITNVLQQGWDLTLFWVGPQSTCWNHPQGGTRFSNTTSTAFAQGTNEAAAARTAVQNLGLTITNTPITYDMEGFNSDATCNASAASFMSGWQSYMSAQSAPSQGGLYTSTCAPGMDNYHNVTYVPAYIMGAQYDNNYDTNAMNCTTSGLWQPNKRLKQYQAPHNETYNGVTLNIDGDNANGPVYP